MWFTGCVRNTQTPSCLLSVAKVSPHELLETFKCHLYSLHTCLCPQSESSVMSASHRHQEGLRDEQNRQSDWSGGGSLHRQQSGHPAHHVHAGGPLPHAHTLLQHSLVRAGSKADTLIIKHRQTHTDTLTDTLMQPYNSNNSVCTCEGMCLQPTDGRRSQV